MRKQHIIATLLLSALALPMVAKAEITEMRGWLLNTEALSGDNPVCEYNFVGLQNDGMFVYIDREVYPEIKDRMACATMKPTRTPVAPFDIRPFRR